MALNFPDTTGQPTNGTFTHTENGTTWSWDGVKWTSKPSGKFTDGSESAPSISFDADQDTGMFSGAANELGFSTGGSRRLTIDSSGRVGIGTDNPSQMLEISGSTPTIELTDTDTGVIHRINANSGAGIWYFDNDINNVGSDGSYVFRHGHLNGGDTVLSISGAGTLTLGPNSGTIRRSGDSDTYINFDGSNDIRFVAGGDYKLWIAPTGIAINKSSAADTDLEIVQSQEPTIRLHDTRDASYKADFIMAGSAPVIRNNNTTTTDRTLSIQKGTTEHLVISGDGKTGIGATSPREMLHVNGNIALGGSETGNYITFKGTTGDGGDASQTQHAFQMTWIGERIWGGTEKSELLFMKGNDVSSPSGPDRIRHVAGEHVFEIYEQGEWSYSDSFETNGANANYDEAMVIKTSGNIRKPMQCLVSAAAASNFNTGYAAQSITNQYSNERNDISSDYNSSTGIFTAPETGYYEIRHMMTATGATGILEPKIYINGTERGRAYDYITSSSSYPRTVTALITHYLVSGDTVQPRYHWSDPMAMATVYGNSSVYMTHFNIYFLQ